MSYCRFSSDDWKSDVYVYENADFGGYTIHVAGTKHVADTPIPEMPEAWHKLDPEVFLSIHKAQMAWVESAKLVPLNLPYDGKTFNFDDIEECISHLLTLREHGYRVPQFAIDALTEEAKYKEAD